MVRRRWPLLLLHACFFLLFLLPGGGARGRARCPCNSSQKREKWTRKDRERTPAVHGNVFNFLFGYSWRTGFVWLSFRKAKSRVRCFPLAVRAECHRRADRRAVAGLQAGVPCRRGFIVRLRGGRGGVGALAGAAARLRARAGLFHLPPFGQRRLVHRLQAEPFPFALVESLKKMGGE